MYFHGSDPAVLISANPDEKELKEQKGHKWIGEATLWTDWSHRGIMKAASECTLLCVHAEEFQHIATQFKSYEFCPSRYAIEYVNRLNSEATDNLSDIVGSEGSSMDIVRILNDLWPEEGPTAQERRSSTLGIVSWMAHRINKRSDDEDAISADGSFSSVSRVKSDSSLSIGNRSSSSSSATMNSVFHGMGSFIGRVSGWVPRSSSSNASSVVSNQPGQGWSNAQDRISERIAEEESAEWVSSGSAADRRSQAKLHEKSHGSNGSTEGRSDLGTLNGSCSGPQPFNSW